MDDVPRYRSFRAKLVLTGLAVICAFGLSIGVGFRIAKNNGLKSSREVISKSTQNIEPVGIFPHLTFDIEFELQAIELSSEINEEILEKWWEVIGVDRQSMRFKELGGSEWYSPQTVKIILKDISPLSKDERWNLYTPVAVSLDSEPVAGLDTFYDSNNPKQLEYWIYYLPDLLMENKPTEDVQKIINQKLFEVLYEGVVGSTALTPQDYQTKYQIVFPKDQQYESIVELEEIKVSHQFLKNILHSNNFWQGLKSDALNAIRGWKLVPEAYAQTCGGNWKCGHLWNQCICSSNNGSCSGNGTECGPGNQGNCNCETICVQETGALNSCNVAYGVCGSGISCSQCVALNTCAWSGPTPTTPPGATCGNGVCAGGESCSSCPADCGGCTSYWRASGETRNATNGLLGGVTLTFAWPSGSPQTVNSGSTQFLNLGVYTMTKNAASVPGSGNFQVTAAKAGHNAFEATNANPGYGCTRINGNSAYSCPMSMGFNKPDPPPRVLHFKERTAPPPTATPLPVPPPTCGFTAGPSGTLQPGVSTAYTATASNANSLTMYHRQVGTTTWTSMAQDTTAPLSATGYFSCLPQNAGKQYDIVCNAQNATRSCTGNPVVPAGMVSCGTNDSRRITCGNPVCGLSLTSDKSSLAPGDRAYMTAAVSNLGSRSVSRVDFTSLNTARITVNPAREAIAPFNTYATAVSSATNGTATINAVATLSDGSTCTGSRAITVLRPNSCQGTLPSGANVCPDDTVGVPLNKSWNRVAGASSCTNTSSTKCQYYFTCGGTAPAGSTQCAGDTSGLTAATSWAQAAGNSCTTTRKCEYTMPPVSCSGTNPSVLGGTACTGDGAQSGTWSRVTGSGNCSSATCQWYCPASAPWNGTRCQTPPTATPRPLATPVPSSCNSPVGLSCGGSCNASGQLAISCSWTRDTRVSGYTFTYDDDSGFGSDATSINLTTSGTSSNATYTMSAALPNRQHWFRVINRVSNGSCTTATSQVSNTSTTGPATCTTYACTNTRPANSSIHAGDQPPTGGNLQWVYSPTDSSRQCEFYCNSGYTFNSSTGSCSTTSYSCGGTRPANTRYYAGDDAPNNSGVNWTYSATNTTTKCQFVCEPGFLWNSTSRTCTLPINACVAPSGASGSISCVGGGTLNGSWNSVSGATSYTYQRNTSASITGAVQATISTTSLSVPIENPAVTNYYRVRAQSVSTSSSCSAPGNWSAWRTVSANTSCAGPTPTDTVVLCPTPYNLNDTSSCVTPVNGTGTVGATWTGDGSVSSYVYQLQSNTSPRTTIASGTVNGNSFTETVASPQSMSLRVRPAGASCNTSWSNRLTIPASSFDPALCNGPTPTPPPYQATINFYQTNATNNCAGTTPLNPILSNAQIHIRNSTTGVNRTQGFSGNSVTVTNLDSIGVNVLTPQYTLANPDYVTPSCTVPINLSSPPTSVRSYYLTKIEGPWWQSSFGDIYGNVLSSNIPPSASNKNLSKSDGGSDAGAVVWNANANLSSGKESEKDFHVRHQSIANLENFDYFNAKLRNHLQSLSSNNINQINISNDGIYRLSGNQALIANWNNVTKKIVVLIEGPNAQLTLRHETPVSIGSGGFVFFVVDGPITFGDQVNEVFGMFLADDDITIQYAMSNQEPFRGYGSFVSTNGNVISHRSLAGDDNNTLPATEFIYDSNLVINTPNVLRTTATVWEEVAP